jgi:hypothetical protein
MNKFNIYTIESPSNVIYPFTRGIFEDLEVFYHGTSNIYTERLEENGFQLGGVPYDMNDILRLCKSYEAIKFYGIGGGGYGVLSAFTAGAYESTGREYMPVSFAYSYWCARRFARNPGGETVFHIVKAGSQLEDLITDADKLSEHRKYLTDRLEHPALAPGAYSERDAWLIALEKLSDRAFLFSELEQALGIRKKYLDMVVGTFPVVYAVKLSDELIETEGQYGWRADREQLLYEDTPSEIRSRGMVPPNAIVGRTDFVNGAVRWEEGETGEGLPLPWL